MPEPSYSELANWSGGVRQYGGFPLPQPTTRLEVVSSRYRDMDALGRQDDPQTSHMTTRTVEMAVRDTTKNATGEGMKAEPLSVFPIADSVKAPPLPQVPLIQLSPFHSQSRLISPPMMSRTSPATDINQLTTFPEADDDTNSLMDADGETDHESSVSVYPIQSTNSTDTRDSTEANLKLSKWPNHDAAQVAVRVRSTSPDNELFRPTKKLRLNLAYVQVPSLPLSRRRASYRFASEIRTLQPQRRRVSLDPMDYAMKLGRVLNAAAAENRRHMSTSSANSPHIEAGEISASASTLSERGRPRDLETKVVQRKAEEVASETHWRGKSTAYDADSESVDSDPGDGIRSTEYELEAAADELEAFCPSVKINIDKFQPVTDQVLHLALRRLLIGSKSLHWPPRSEQSVTSSLPQAPPMFKVNALAEPSSTRQQHAPMSPAFLPHSSINARTSGSQPTMPLPRRHMFKQPPAPRPPSPIPPPPTVSQMDNDQSVDFDTLFTDCDITNFGVSELQPTPSTNGFHTLEHILDHTHAEGPEAAFYLEKASYQGQRTPSTNLIGDFLTRSGSCALDECNSVYPWAMLGVGQESADPGGTIDPALLGGPARGEGQIPSSMSQGLEPIAGPSRTPDHRRSPKLSSRSRSSSQTHSLSTASNSTASDDEPLSTDLRHQFPALSRAMSAVREGKRRRRPTERAMAMRYALDADGSEDSYMSLDFGQEKSTSRRGKGKGKGRMKGQGTGIVQAKPRGSNAMADNPKYLSTCHQCRNNKTWRTKMYCTSIRKSGARCNYYYCDHCIASRYPDMIFADDFICPHCQGICNCTVCSRRRNVPYVSARATTRHVHNGDREPPTTAIMKKAKRAPAPNRKPRQQLPPLNMVSGQFFGVVYGWQGEPTGQSFIADSNQPIDSEKHVNTVGTARAPARRKKQDQFSRPIAYIGKRRIPTSRSSPLAKSQEPHKHNSITEKTPPPPLPHSRSRRMYIGDPSVFKKGIYVSMDEIIERAMESEEDMWGGPLSDPPSAEDHDDLANSAPAVPHNTFDVQCAIALALHRLQSSPKEQAKDGSAVVMGT